MTRTSNSKGNCWPVFKPKNIFKKIYDRELKHCDLFSLKILSGEKDKGTDSAHRRVSHPSPPPLAEPY